MRRGGMDAASVHMTNMYFLVPSYEDPYYNPYSGQGFIDHVSTSVTIVHASHENRYFMLPAAGMNDQCGTKIGCLPVTVGSMISPPCLSQNPVL